MPGHNAYPDEVREDFVTKVRDLMNGEEKLSLTAAANRLAQPGGPSGATIIGWAKPKPPQSRPSRAKRNGHAKFGKDRGEALAVIENLMGEGFTLPEAMKAVSDLPGGPTMSKLKTWAEEANLTPGKAVATVAPQKIATAEDVQPEQALEPAGERELIARLDAANAENGELRTKLREALVALDAADQIIDQFCPHVATYMNFRQRVA
ncbi:hypothetical protein [Nocardia sp. NPDC057030]|uniref:hypothetical protein n=1 Tax=unclassified Nocardia TaxID=2637762 RepID=UPI00363154B6